MVWTTSITDVLNQWNQMGVFSYVIPFLLIFAVVYGVLAKVKIFGEDSRGVNAIIALAIGLLALQFDFVSTFFATIFPRFGIGLAIVVVVVILMGIFVENMEGMKGLKWMGLGIGIAVVLWALSQWSWSLDSWGIGAFFADNFWALMIGVLIVVAIGMIVKKPRAGK